MVFSRSNNLSSQLPSRHVKTALCIAAVFFILFGKAAYAAYPVAMETAVENHASAAYASTTQQTWVAYLRNTDVVVKRFDQNGNPTGLTLYPFISAAGNVPAVTGPAIVYSDVSDQIAVAALIDSPTFNSVFLVLQKYDVTGTPIGDLNLLLGAREYYPGSSSELAGLRMAHNSSTDELVLSLQITENNNNLVRAIRYDLGGISGTPGYVSGSQKDLFNANLNGFTTHAMAHAPVSQVPGGRYLLVVDGVAKILDSSLNLLSQLPINWGTPHGDFGQFDVAYGTLEAQNRFLVVWSDGNNCLPPYGPVCSASYQQATGVWGTFVDPADLSYTNRSNTPFPITGGPLIHVGNRFLYTPRVAFDFVAETFVVGWREVPYLNNVNDESLSHIRAAAITHYIPDNLIGTTLANAPPKNYVISSVTGQCSQGPCFSDQDPVLPFVVDNRDQNSSLVWAQRFVYNTLDIDLYAQTFLPDSPVNDHFANAITLQANASTRGTTVYASHDGSTSCDRSSNARDVWYRFSAPQAGIFRIDTCGTNNRFGSDGGVNTVISLHTSTAAEIPNHCNDNWPTQTNIDCTAQDPGLRRDSATQISMQAGQQIWVRISTYADFHPGEFLLNTTFATR